MDIVKQLLLQLVLILCNAFFAATEIAVISLNEKKVKSRAEDGDKKAVKMLKMIEEPTRFLSTIQIGITLAGFLASAFAADSFAERLSGYLVTTFNVPQTSAGLIQNVSVVVITIILSFFTLVLGELVPKRIAMRNKEKFAEAVCGLISFIAAVLRPIIWFLTISTNLVLRIFGIDPNEKEETVSEEDIVLMLDAGADEGSLKEDDIEYIKNVFKLDKMTAEDVMTPRKSVVFISSDANDKEIMETIVTEGYSRIPILDAEEDNITGILYAKDYLIHRKEPKFSLDSVVFQPTFVPESVHLDVLFKDMQKDRNHIVVVVNEYGEASGIVTMEDIIEELLGEIWDEGDEAVEDFLQLSETKYRVLTTALVEEFVEFFSIESEVETESTTINGWLTEQSGTIPEVGYELEYDNLKIVVTKANDLMTEEIEVEIVPISEETDEETEQE